MVDPNADAYMESAVPAREETSLIAPLREPVFRRIWASSLLSNFGLLIVSIAAAWEMTRISGDPTLVALVQSAIMAPFMIFSLVAGALADIFDRRKIGLIALLFPAIGTLSLTATTLLGLATPFHLLSLCFLVGLGLAVFSPAWQASVGEQVSRRMLPAAIALNGISFNIARTIGPAFGGALVATAGTAIAFGVSFALYVPLFFALLIWRRPKEPSRLPPEKLNGALAAGLRYAHYSPGLKRVLVRAFTISFALSAIHALTPLVARDILGGGADLFGLLLSSIGAGSIAGAMIVARLQEKFEPEVILRTATVVIAVAIAGTGLSQNQWLTMLMLGLAGMSWMIVVTLLNVLVQMGSPRWVTARALGLFQTLFAGGMALGSWTWGELASTAGLPVAFLCAAGTMILFLGFGLLQPIERAHGHSSPPGEMRPDPDVTLAITGRSGPITMELEYRIDPARAREFYRMVSELGRFKRRNGAQMWTIARDLHDPAVWVERYRYATWDEFLRNRNRDTEAERNLQARIARMSEGEKIGVRRFLDRPVGSVRWNEATPDRADGDYFPPTIS